MKYIRKLWKSEGIEKKRWTKYGKSIYIEQSFDIKGSHFYA
ncbi:hypothetical protein LEP1GSC017_3006 [Leptospira meyeri serovar Hardjo str. Went 5]|nr:hypothetical protein LEP1GSC017_3006 [Leptospira meyeri serovar Hardjo str. Went 5]EMJ86752.1 hypothetical protein LEP1GSC196_3909 [Leptospira meyeri serovar Semaranga str. Veldrot Semarang 173]